jgi:hypothetical protein
MVKTGFGNWKGPFKEAVKGEDYIDPCPSGTYLVRGYKRPDGVEVPAYCRKYGNTTEIPERYAYKSR